MRVAQFLTIAHLLEEAKLPSDRGINFTQFTSGRVSLRFMDMEGNFQNYMIERDGTYSTDVEV